MTTPDVLAPPAWVRSAAFRHIFTNYFRYRMGIGELTLVLCRHSDQPTPQPAVTIDEEVAVSMSWPQMKVLAQFLSEAVAQIEAVSGPIPQQIGITRESMRMGLQNQVRGLNITTSDEAALNPNGP